MPDTIQSKMQTSTTRIFRENLDIMVQFAIIDERQKDFINRVLDSFKYGDKKLDLKSIDIFFTHDKDMFGEDLLKLVLPNEEKQ